MRLSSKLVPARNEVFFNVYLFIILYFQKVLTLLPLEPWKVPCTELIRKLYIFCPPMLGNMAAHWDYISISLGTPMGIHSSKGLFQEDEISRVVFVSEVLCQQAPVITQKLHVNDTFKVVSNLFQQLFTVHAAA